MKIRVTGIDIIKIRGLYYSIVEDEKGKKYYFYDGGYSFLDIGETREVNLNNLIKEEEFDEEEIEDAIDDCEAMQ